MRRVPARAAAFGRSRRAACLLARLRSELHERLVHLALKPNPIYIGRWRPEPRQDLRHLAARKARPGRRAALDLIHRHRHNHHPSPPCALWRLTALATRAYRQRRARALRSLRLEPHGQPRAGSQWPPGVRLRKRASPGAPRKRKHADDGVLAQQVRDLRRAAPRTAPTAAPPLTPDAASISPMAHSAGVVRGRAPCSRSEMGQWEVPCPIPCKT